MAECPNCHAQIEIAEINFGTLFNCPVCSAMFFVGWNGQPEMNQEPIPPAADTPMVEDVPTEFPPFESEPPPAVEMTPSFEASELLPPLKQGESFEDVVNFSNQTQESGALSYDVIIRGIDLAQQVELLKEAIQDSRFGWSSDQILSQVQNGELIFKNLNPIKASILIQRVKYAELEIEWSQNVLS